MLALVLYALLAVAVMVAVFFIVASLVPAGEQIAPPIRDERPWELPDDRELGADDVAAVRLPVALRGYRFAETDQLLDRLGEALRSRDEMIARLLVDGWAAPEQPATPDERSGQGSVSEAEPEPGDGAGDTGHAG